MKQYGFYFDSTKCTGCKTCQVSCKDEKDLDLGPKFRRVYEFGGGSWQNKMVYGSKTFSITIFLFHVTIAQTQRVSRVAQQAPCINGKKMV